MAWGNKAELIAENAALKREVELLRNYMQEKKEELFELKQQLKYTQEALVAKESPEAYRDQKYTEELANRPEESQEEKEQRKLENKIVSEHLSQMEGPLFKDVDDMMQLLMRADIPVAKSVHDNNES